MLFTNLACQLHQRLLCDRDSICYAAHNIYVQDGSSTPIQITLENLELQLRLRVWALPYLDTDLDSESLDDR